MFQVDRRGVEPRLPGCKPSVFPLDQRPIVRQEVRPGIEPGPRLVSLLLPRTAFIPRYRSAAALARAAETLTDRLIAESGFAIPQSEFQNPQSK